MRKFALIGFPLKHSFSKKYFTEEFQEMNTADHQYDLIEMETVDHFMTLWEDPDLIGLNVTIPHKENVKKFMTRFDASAEKVGAVNVIKRVGNDLVGYNSDYYGFRKSLLTFLGQEHNVKSALILGTGGASKAVKAVLNDLSITINTVSRQKEKANYSYEELIKNPELVKKTDLIINSTPLGTFPNIDECPNLPYESLHSNQFLYDLVYNPERTLFLKKGMDMGASVKNGYDMLVFQAERSWEIWND